jgi:pimeloyl-ACP methyl ester carboxylesterase
VLAGGPGQSATASFGGQTIGSSYPARFNRDVIVFDQRGTGLSGLLRCRRLERANLLRAGPAAADCARSLGSRRAFYTSRDSVDDIEAIREQLGAERIALYGTSYGTKVALGYARRYPTRVERLVLDSVVEIDGPDPYYRDSMQAVPRALRSLCGRDCGWTRDPVADVTALVRRIGRNGPLSGRLPDVHGRLRAGEVARVDIFNTLVAGDFDPTLRAAFPGAVRSALRGDVAPLLRLKERALLVDAVPPPPRSLSSAAYAATSCEEVRLPWARATPPDPAERHRQAAAAALAIPASAFAPFDRATALASDTLDLCEAWPNAPVAPSFGSGPLPDVPVLLVEGEDDLRTPVENARRTAELFPRVKLVVARQTGHSAIGSDFSGCAQRAFERFLERRSVSTRCPRFRREFPATAPPPTRLAAVRRLRGTHGVRGRTLAALQLTLFDVADDVFTHIFFEPSGVVLARGGGLRAGRYRMARSGTLELHGVSFVPGVTLTGRIEDFLSRGQRGRVRIGGGAGPHGVLAIRGHRVSGRLDGRAVRTSLRARAAVAALSARRDPGRLPR